MGLVDLWTPKPDWTVFWFNNWISHQAIVQAIGKQKNIALTIYPIDPWVEEDKEQILVNHFQFHNEMNQALGFSGLDLSTLDFEDETAVRQWTWQNFNEHQAVLAALKINP